MSSEEWQTNVSDKMGVIVRPMKEEDAPTVARIWAEGLTQTADAAFILFRSSIRNYLVKYGEEALSPNGDVGSDGCNLLPSWSGEDRVMLVACLEEDPNNAVGCVGVKVGSDYQKQQPDSTEASIWRMSVDTSVRRRGVGKALMRRAEEWAEQSGCTSMKLVTANSIAAKFYCDKMGFKKEPEECNCIDIKALDRPRPLWYRKSLVEQNGNK